MPRSLRAVPLAPVLLASAVAGCGGNTGTEDPEITFHRDVAPILQARCQECHRAGEIAPMPLLTYEESRPYAALMAGRAEDGSMPPWGARVTEECQPRFPYGEDPSLSDGEKEVLRRWADLGAPEGDPADAPPPVAFEATDLPGTTLELQNADGWVVEPGPDQYRCFVFDPGWETDALIDGAHVIAGNPEVAHHALVYVDPDREALDLAPVGGSYECFGSARIDAFLLNGWAPGMRPVELPEGAAFWVPGGSLIVVQMHYHPTGDQPSEPDRTRVQLRQTDTLPEWYGFVNLDGNYGSQDRDGFGLQPGPDDRGEEPEFRIPADSPAHVESQISNYGDLAGYDRFKILGVAAHMHYVGQDMLIQVEHARPEPWETKMEGLLQVPEWDFNWQRFYYFDAPIEDLPEVRPDDRVHTRCTYDNTLGNPFVADALEEEGLDQPQDVYLGEETLDEMCLAGLVMLVKI